MAKGFKMLTENEFRSIKTLQDAGVKAATTARATGRSNSTVGYIYKAETFSDYKAIVAARVWKPSSADVDPKQDSNKVEPQDNRIIDLLESIDKRLETIETSRRKLF